MFGLGRGDVLPHLHPHAQGLHRVLREALRLGDHRFARDVAKAMWLEFARRWATGSLITEWKGKNLLFIGGGIGMAPMRSLFNFCLDNRADYADIITIYGARTPGDLCFTYEFDEWRTKGKLYLTVDQGDENWKDHVGHVPGYLKELAPKPENTIAITCGPPIMIKFALMELANLGFTNEQIYTTLEMKMKCGIGKCGRCNIGDKFVCLDGPVFSYAQIQGTSAGVLEVNRRALIGQSKHWLPYVILSMDESVLLGTAYPCNTRSKA